MEQLLICHLEHLNLQGPAPAGHGVGCCAHGMVWEPGNCQMAWSNGSVTPQKDAKQFFLSMTFYKLQFLVNIFFYTFAVVVKHIATTHDLIIFSRSIEFSSGRSLGESAIRRQIHVTSICSKRTKQFIKPKPSRCRKVITQCGFRSAANKFKHH